MTTTPTDAIPVDTLSFEAAMDELDRVVGALEAGGADSIVIAGGATRLRVHAHTGSPQALFDACARQGQVQGGDVAEADKPFGMLAKPGEVELPH